MEKVIWMIERVKSGLQSFMPETFHRWVDEGRLIAITLLENNQRYTTRKLNTPLKSMKIISTKFGILDKSSERN